MWVLGGPPDDGASARHDGPEIHDDGPRTDETPRPRATRSPPACPDGRTPSAAALVPLRGACHDTQGRGFNRFDPRRACSTMTAPPVPMPPRSALRLGPVTCVAALACSRLTPAPLRARGRTAPPPVATARAAPPPAGRIRRPHVGALDRRAERLGGVRAPVSPRSRRGIDDAVNSAIARGEVPGAVVAVVRGGRVVLARAYGLRSKRDPEERPMRVDSRSSTPPRSPRSAATGAERDAPRRAGQDQR